MSITLHKDDLPDGFDPGGAVALDTETMGLQHGRDRLCLVQLSTGDGNAHLVQIAKDAKPAPRLCAILSDPEILKLFHFARFDVASLAQEFGIFAAPVYCTKIASKLTRTFSDRHGLSALTSELLGVEISKAKQSSDWGAEELSEAQLEYAASDVLYLHALREKLDAMLKREGREGLAQACFDFLPARARLDLAGWPGTDIFAH